MAVIIKPATPTQTILSLALEARTSLKETSVQIATGQKHPDFKGYAGDGTVGNIISFSSTVKSTDVFISSNNLVAARIESQDLAVSQIQDIASQVSNLIAQRRNSASGEDIPITAIGTSMLDDIAGKMNIKFDGRYLFSGTKTNTLPFPTPQTSNLDDNNAATSNYYAGNSTSPVTKIDDSQDITYGVRGNEQGFQELIASVHLLIEGHTTSDDDILAEAVDMVNSAVANIASSRAVLTAAKDTMEQTTNALLSVNLLITENLVEIGQTDIVEATTRMSELEATIQATFLAFTRLNELRLSNFL